MKQCSEFYEIYTTFRAFVKTQHSVVIKCFRCNLDGEYTSNKFCQLFALDGTIHQTSCIDTPEQNDVAKRKHRHIIETACSLLLSASVPSDFWGEAVLIAVSLINIIPSSYLILKKLYGMSLIIPPLEFLVVSVSFFVLMQNAINCPFVLLFVSF